VRAVRRFERAVDTSTSAVPSEEGTTTGTGPSSGIVGIGAEETGAAVVEAAITRTGLPRGDQEAASRGRPPWAAAAAAKGL